MSDVNQTISATRREFLKTSAGLAAGAALAGPLIRPAGAYLQASDEIKIALIGCGGRGSGACSQALSTRGPVKLIAVADAFEDQARNAVHALKNEHGERVDVKDDNIFVGFDAYKHAIDSGIDLILIATSPGFRPRSGAGTSVAASTACAKASAWATAEFAATRSA